MRNLLYMEQVCWRPGKATCNNVSLLRAEMCSEEILYCRHLSRAELPVEILGKVTSHEDAKTVAQVGIKGS